MTLQRIILVILLNSVTRYLNANHNIPVDMERASFLQTLRDYENHNILKKTAPKVIYVDGIRHFRHYDNNVASRKSQKTTKSQQIEAEFKNILNMTAVKYIFKRGWYWRSWREVQNQNGDRSIVFYRCQGSGVTGKCRDGGYWVIEEDLKCPIEIFSVIDKQAICAANMRDFRSTLHTCSRTDKTQMSACTNPIVTTYRITSNADGLNTLRICGDKYNCEIKTFYNINPKNIVFRIVNTSNHITYSRVMKNYNRTYTCEDNCGHMTPSGPVASQHDTKQRTYLDPMLKPTADIEKVLFPLDENPKSKVLVYAKTKLPFLGNNKDIVVIDLHDHFKQKG